MVIKPTSAGDREKFTVTVDVNGTVADLKAVVAEHSKVPVTDQRLIYKGKVLKDDKQLKSDYGKLAGHAPPNGNLCRTGVLQASARARLINYNLLTHMQDMRTATSFTWWAGLPQAGKPAPVMPVGCT